MTRGRALVPALGIAALGALALWPTLDGQWLNWDDEVNFVNNPHFRGLGWAELRWMLTTSLLAVYTPLAWMTLGLNWLAGGLDPWGYHLGNVLLHAANAGLFFLVARRLLVAGLGERLPASAADPPGVMAGAALAALVFAAHPLRVESVAWATERRDVLSAFFYLLAVLAYLRGIAPDGRLARGARLASLAAFAAALLSKGLAMTLPVSLLLLDVYPLRRVQARGWGALAREKAGYLVLAALAALAALWAVGRGARWTSWAEHALPARVAMTGYSLWFYPSRLVWPEGLSPYYEMPERVLLSQWRFLGPVCAVTAVTLVLAALARRWPAGLAAWAHSAIVVAPVSGIVHAGAQLAHDRYSYLSGLGFAVLAGAGLGWVLRGHARGTIGRAGPAAALGGAALVVAVLGAGAWEQAAAWRDSESLWRTAVEADPGCMICRNNLGNVLLGQGRLAEAEVQYRRAAALRARAAEPRNNLGIVLAAERRYPEAEAAFREALGLDPGLTGGVANLGLLYAEEGRWAEATPLLRRALAEAPGIPRLGAVAARAFRARAGELAGQGRQAEAAALLESAAALERAR